MGEFRAEPLDEFMPPNTSEGAIRKAGDIFIGGFTAGVASVTNEVNREKDLAGVHDALERVYRDLFDEIAERFGPKFTAEFIVGLLNRRARTPDDR